MAELADLDAVLALFNALMADPVMGIEEIIPAARTLMICTAPGVYADARLAGQIMVRATRVVMARQVQADVVPPLEIPVTYDGVDLSDAARHMGLSMAGLIAAHQAATWTVAFCGFAPGFGYMMADDPQFDLPRRAESRTRIPAGTVALAGRFGGIYPQESPGGWQLIGTTSLKMWDPARDPPALLIPGRRVRFVEQTGVIASIAPAARPDPADPIRGLHVLSTAFPVLVQDAGRTGQASQGVTVSGALDGGALYRVNQRLGNPAAGAVLEITLGPTRFAVGQPATLALDGAADTAWIEVGAARIAVDVARPFALDPDEVLVIPIPTCGIRSYLAVRGGLTIAPVLGSAATDTLSGTGPAPLLAGGVVGLANGPALAVDPNPAERWQLPGVGDVVCLPVTLGPRTDWFSSDMIALFLQQNWEVTTQSSRIGIRLSGAVPLLRDDMRELPSEGVAIGAVQIPHSGQPVLFLADHPLTGGYPVIATLLPEALDLAGQLSPGTRLRFTAAQPFVPIQPEMP